MSPLCARSTCSSHVPVFSSPASEERLMNRNSLLVLSALLCTRSAKIHAAWSIELRGEGCRERERGETDSAANCQSSVCKRTTIPGVIWLRQDDPPYIPSARLFYD
uniref:Secreted protein n=1 Tax=Knipowitschia caucasica TaxID=637954 RepID=A0AAV2KD04_KNICA